MPAKTDTSHHDERIAQMTFASVYPHYVAKEELHQVIEWLTGYDEQKIQELIDSKVNFEDFFKGATLNPNAHLITGVICGYRVEEITNKTTRECRYLDKLIDELARGKKMENILRGSK